MNIRWDFDSQNISYGDDPINQIYQSINQKILIQLLHCEDLQLCSVFYLCKLNIPWKNKTFEDFIVHEFLTDCLLVGLKDLNCWYGEVIVWSCLLCCSWRCSARWWRCSRPDTWCWWITCRTTTGSSRSSSWVRCSPPTPAPRRSSHQVRVQHTGLSTKMCRWLSCSSVYIPYYYNISPVRSETSVWPLVWRIPR